MAQHTVFRITGDTLVRCIDSAQVVAGRAGPGGRIGRVAGRTGATSAIVIHGEGVIKSGILPSTGRVTHRTLPGVMASRRLAGMARLAVGCPCWVSEGRRLPGLRRMAGRTLPSVMVGRKLFGVAGLAVRGLCSGMVEMGRSPGLG